MATGLVRIGAVIGAVIAVVGCGGSAKQTEGPPTLPGDPPAETTGTETATATATYPAVESVPPVPPGWIDVVVTPRETFEQIEPGMYDVAYPMVERNDYIAFAFELRAGPDKGSMMTMLPLGREGTLDDAFLDQFVTNNNLNLDPGMIVEKKMLSQGGQPLAKLRAEYEAHSGRVSTLVYLFPWTDGDVIQLVFVVPAARYDALRPHLEAIETDEQVLKKIHARKRR